MLYNGRMCARDSSPLNARTLAAWVFVFLCAVYLLTYSGVITLSDEVVMMAATESLAKRGEFSANQTFWRESKNNLDPDKVEVVPGFEPLQPLLTAPLAWLALHLPHVGLIHLTLLFSILITALTAIAIMALVRELGYSAPIAAFCALIFGVGTMAFPYSKMFFREPLAALLLALAMLFFTRAMRRRTVADALLCVLCLGASDFAKEVSLLALPAFVLALADAARAWPRLRQRRWMLALVSLVVVVGAIGLAWLILRPGSAGFLGRTLSGLTNLGSRANALPQIAQALLGYLISPGKSFFVFTPISLATLWAFPRFYRAHRREAMVVGGISLMWLVGYATLKTDIWWGGLGWGPRFLEPLAAFAVVPLAPLLADLTRTRSRWPCIAFALLLVISIYVQFVGVGLDIRVYADALGTIEGDTKLMSSIWEPQYAPPIWTVPLLLRPDNWNFSWARYIWGHAAIELGQFDWPVLGASLLFLLASAVALWGAFYPRSTFARRSCARAWGAAILATSLVMGLIVFAIYDDPRFFGGDDRRQLLQAVDAQDQPNDALLLNDQTLIRFVMNYSRSPIEWYSVKSEPELSDEARTLMDYLIKTNPRIWLMLNYSPNRRAPRHIENYLTARAYPIQQQVFSDYAQLVLYSTVAAPDPQQAKQPTAWRLADEIELSGFNLSNNQLSAVYARGAYVQLSLLWKALRPVARNYTVFVQLLGPDGHVVWQADRQPVNGARPTSGWHPHEAIRDNYGFIIPPDWSAGAYHLIAGLYEWPSLKRLPVHGDGLPERDYLDLGAIAIR